MASEGTGRFYWADRSRALIHVAKAVAEDTGFPFEDGEKVSIRMDVLARKLIIEKMETAAVPKVRRPD